MKLSVVVAVLAAVGMARTAYLHFVSEPRNDFQRERIDPRYAAVRALLPPSGEIGYVSDEKVAIGPAGIEASAIGNRIYEQAQYALAPLILRYDDASAPIVLANLNDPGKLPALLRERGLTVVATPAPTTVILRPR
jgi:hypothetical protein